jgi:hypothetical protein
VHRALALIGQDVGGELAREAGGGREACPQQQSSIAGAIPDNVSRIVSESIQASAKWLEANGARSIADDAA